MIRRNFYGTHDIDSSLEVQKRKSGKLFFNVAIVVKRDYYALVVWENV